MATELNYIPLDDCQSGGVYEIYSRNLTVGVFDIKTNGFIGIREKFGSEFLFTELHRDLGPPHGTVAPKKLLTQLPSNIEIEEYNETVCQNCYQAVTFVPDNPLVSRTPGTWVHDAAKDCDKPEAGSSIYQPLFIYLQNIEHS
mgnify:CR=1 FL=1